MLIDAPALYDLDPRVRWAAARRLHTEQPQEVEAEIKIRYAMWPKFRWGVINPWLVFVGPSPGSSGSRPIDWDRERMPTIGQAQVHFKEYGDSVGFWSRMREWTTNAFALAGLFPKKSDAALGSVLLAARKIVTAAAYALRSGQVADILVLHTTYLAPDDTFRCGNNH